MRGTFAISVSAVCCALLCCGCGLVFRKGPPPPAPVVEAPAPAVEVAEEEAPPVESLITGITTTVLEDATLVRIQGTTPIQYTAFRLSGPPRLVLDVSNIRFTSAPEGIEVQKGLVRGLNLSRIYDRDITRIELVLESLRSYDIAREGNALEITLSGEAPGVARRKAVEGLPAAHKIAGVAYYRAGDTWRIIVEVKGNEPRFSVVRLEDPLRLYVDLEDTVVPTELQQVQVIDDPSSVVSNVSTFQFKQEPNPRARVIAQLNEFTPYIVYQVGNNIYLDFESPISIAEAVPEALPEPVLEEPEPLVVPVAEAPTEWEPAPEAVGEYVGRKISLDFQDAEINDVLRLLAEISGYNIITSPEVGGSISISMKEVPWDQALEVILRMAKLDQYREGNILMVDTIPNIEELRLEKEAEAGAQVFAVPAEVGGEVLGEVIAEAPTPLEVSPAPPPPAPLSMVTRYFTLNYIGTDRSGTGTLTTSSGTATLATGQTTISTTDQFQLWDVLEDELRKLMSPTDQDERIMVNKTAGLIRITDYPENIERIGEFLEIMEDSLLQQVLIEANILEVFLEEETQLGVDWTYVAEFLQGKGVLGGLEGGAVLEFSKGEIPPISPSQFRFGITSADFRLVADALSTQGSVRTISNPRVSTLNNQKAVIRVGTQEAYFEGTTSVAGATGAVITTYRPQFITVGLVLDVTPRVDLGGYITMEVHPSVTSLVRFEQSPRGDTAPVVSVRESDTVIKVNDAQTIIIAGFISSRIQETETGVPILRSIPLMGRIFRHETTEKDRTELVILLKPTIVSEERVEELTQRDIDFIREMREQFSGGAL